MNIDYLDGVRGLVVLVTVIIMALYVIRYVQAFRAMQFGPRLYFASMVCIFATVTWDTVVLMLNEVPFSLRMVPFVLGVTLSLIYFLEPWDAVKKRIASDPLDLDNVSEEVLDLRAENEELRDRLYRAIRTENATKLRMMAVETINESLREDRRFARDSKEDKERTQTLRDKAQELKDQAQQLRDEDRAEIRQKAAEGIVRQDAEDADDGPFVQAERDQERADDRLKAQDEIDRQDEEDRQL